MGEDKICAMTETIARVNEFDARLKLFNLMRLCQVAECVEVVE